MSDRTAGLNFAVFISHMLHVTPGTFGTVSHFYRIYKRCFFFLSKWRKTSKTNSIKAWKKLIIFTEEEKSTSKTSKRTQESESEGPRASAAATTAEAEWRQGRREGEKREEEWWRDSADTREEQQERTPVKFLQRLFAESPSTCFITCFQVQNPFGPCTCPTLLWSSELRPRAHNTFTELLVHILLL